MSNRPSSLQIRQSFVMSTLRISPSTHLVKSSSPRRNWNTSGIEIIYKLKLCVESDWFTVSIQFVSSSQENWECRTMKWSWVYPYYSKYCYVQQDSRIQQRQQQRHKIFRTTKFWQNEWKILLCATRFKNNPPPLMVMNYVN